MTNLRGLYIDDKPENRFVYSLKFSQEGLNVDAIDELFDDVEQYYDYFYDNSFDYFILDYELNGVTYDGLDVLRNIREIDDTVFVLLLTNKDYNAIGHELSEFDYVIAKSEIANEIMNFKKRMLRYHKFKAKAKEVYIYSNKLVHGE